MMFLFGFIVCCLTLLSFIVNRGENFYFLSLPFEYLLDLFPYLYIFLSEIKYNHH